MSFQDVEEWKGFYLGAGGGLDRGVGKALQGVALEEIQG